MVWHEWATLKSIHATKDEISYVFNVCLANIAPKQRTVFDVALKQLFVAVKEKDVIQLLSPTRQTCIPPIDTLVATGMVS